MYLAGAGYYGIEQALAAEYHVFHTLDHLHVHGAGLVHYRQHAGVAYQPFAGGEIVILAVAVHLEEHEAGARYLLHYKALAAHKARAQLLLEEHGKLNAVCGAEEGVLLADYALARAKLPGYYPSGEGGGKRYFRRLLSGVEVHKEAFAHEHPPERLACAAEGGDRGIHSAPRPRPAARLAYHGLAGVEVDYYGG